MDCAVGAVCAAAFRGGGKVGEGIHVSMYLDGRGLKESVCLLDSIDGRLTKLNGGGA